MMKKLLVFLLVCFTSASMFAYTVNQEGCAGFATKLCGALYIDGVEQFNANLEIGAFDENGLCRGAATPNYISTSQRYYYQIRLWGVEGMAYTFRVYDHENECELDLVDDFGETITYIGNAYWQYNNANCGPRNFYPINFTHTYTLEIDPYTGEKDNYYLIASPVGAVNAEEVQGLMTPAYDLYSYSHTPDDEGKEWINHRDVADFTLQPGYGYLYANNTGTDLVFIGTGITEGSYNVDLDYVTDNPDFPNESWNLLGNPFCVDATIGDTKPFYRLVGDVLAPQDAGTPIPAMEGFFVNAVESGESIQIEVAPQQGNKAPMLALNLSNGGKVVDRAIVSFGQGQQLPKFQLFKNSNVYIPMDGNDYALVRSEGMGEMPVSFKAESNGTYSLTLSSENVDFAYLHLIDNLTGADQDLLANPSYSFSANTNDYASRFKLVFATGDNDNSEAFAFFSNGSLVINNEGNATLQVVDVIGRILKCENINGCANVNVNAAPGVYMIRLINGDNVKVQKVVVR